MLAAKLSYRRALGLFVVLGALVLTGLELEAAPRGKAKAGHRSPAIQLRSKKSGKAIHKQHKKKQHKKKKTAHRKKKVKAKKRAHIPSHVPRFLPPKKVTTIEHPALNASESPL